MQKKPCVKNWLKRRKKERNKEKKEQKKKQIKEMNLNQVNFSKTLEKYRNKIKRKRILKGQLKLVVKVYPKLIIMEMLRDLKFDYIFY